jgi:uncharacterized membrane protein
MKESRLIVALVMLFVLVLFSGTVLAATLHGKIYDIELNELNDVVVMVDSEPEQRYVSKDGGYSFELNPGDYVLTAVYSPDELHEYTAEEQISIKEEGDYVYDLFLFPGFDLEDEELLAETDLVDVEETIVDEDGRDWTLIVVVIAVVVVVLLIILYFVVGRMKRKEETEEIKEAEKMEEGARKTLKKEMEDASMRKVKRPGKKRAREDDEFDLRKVIDIIKKEGGRTTQKELRKQIPLSEAKISLMISELEHKKIVQKVN